VSNPVKRKEPAAFGISARMARALADSWRVRILSELSVRPMSPSQFVEEVGGELTHVSRCFRQLAEWGFVEVIEERPGRRRGAAIEHVYRGIRRAHFDSATPSRAPPSAPTSPASAKRSRAAPSTPRSTVTFPGTGSPWIAPPGSSWASDWMRCSIGSPSSRSTRTSDCKVQTRSAFPPLSGFPPFVRLSRRRRCCEPPGATNRHQMSLPNQPLARRWRRRFRIDGAPGS
jgi:hypothetical protein